VTSLSGSVGLRGEDHSRLAGDGQEAARRRAAQGVIVTSISRGGEVVLPSGDTVIVAGDRLSLLSREHRRTHPSWG
jgi:Trk K+ transport system NAD-binding subunit